MCQHKVLCAMVRRFDFNKLTGLQKPGYAIKYLEQLYYCLYYCTLLLSLAYTV